MLQRAIHPVAWQSDARAVEPLIYSLTECSVNYFMFSQDHSWCPVRKNISNYQQT